MSVNALFLIPTMLHPSPRLLYIVHQVYSPKVSVVKPCDQIYLLDCESSRLQSRARAHGISMKSVDIPVISRLERDLLEQGIVDSVRVAALATG